MKRREFIAGLGSVAAWQLVAHAQQSKMPVVAFLNGGAGEANALTVAAFRKGLSETAYVEDQNVTVEYDWLEASQYDRLPALMADLVRRRVAVIATPGDNDAALAAKAATATIPIVFGVTEDPVKLGLVASLARPGGNATGMNFLVTEIAAKRLALLHELVPKAVRVAVLLNPVSSESETILRAVQEAARAIGLQIRVLNASTSNEIDAAFATLEHERPDALFVAPNAFFNSSRTQIATLTARERIPSALSQRVAVEAGGLMSYGTNAVDMVRQVGVYTGNILKGTKPADLPVVQPTKFELVINLKTAKALGLTIPETLLATADEVIQ